MVGEDDLTSAFGTMSHLVWETTTTTGLSLSLSLYLSLTHKHSLTLSVSLFPLSRARPLSLDPSLHPFIHVCLTCV